MSERIEVVSEKGEHVCWVSPKSSRFLRSEARRQKRSLQTVFLRMLRKGLRRDLTHS